MSPLAEPQQPPQTPADYIARAKAEIANGFADTATARALIAIAELLQVNIADVFASGVMTGGTATADALSQILNVVSPSQFCAKPETPQATDISAATHAMCHALFGADFDLHEQDDEDRAHYERAAEAAIEASR